MREFRKLVRTHCRVSLEQLLEVRNGYELDVVNLEKLHVVGNEADCSLKTLKFSIINFRREIQFFTIKTKEFEFYMCEAFSSISSFNVVLHLMWT